MTELSVLVVGAGSIGRRHGRNLRQLGVEDLRVVDLDPARAAALGAELGATVHPDLAAALAAAPTVALIATPSHLHREQAQAAAAAGCHLFIEKPLATATAGLDELAAAVRAAGRHAFVGCNLRFDEVYAAAKQRLDGCALGRVHGAHFHFGYDLAAWRPGVDYRTVYSAWRAQGGGVLLDAIHELDLALAWFGPPARVLAAPRRTGALEGDVEDCADLIVEHRSGLVSTIHLDYRDPVYRRFAWVAGERGILEADFAARTVTERRPGAEPEVARFADDRNAMYVAELAHFLAVVRGEARPVADLGDGRLALELALGSRDRGPVVELPQPRVVVDRIAVVLQARTGSKRLPGKVLMTACGKTMIELLVERLRRAKRVSQVILATSVAPADQAVADEAERLGVPWFRGSEEDVLGRYVGAVRQFDLPAVVRLTGDCPLMDPAVVDAAIERFLALQPDYLSNVYPRSYPDGLDVEIVSRAALERADREMQDPAIREHVTYHLARHPERYRHASLGHPDAARLAPLRWTLDTARDYEVIRQIFEALYPEQPDFGMADVLALLERRPELRLENP